MANIQLKIVGLGDFSSVNQQLNQVQTQVNLLSKSIAGVGLSSSLTKELNSIQAGFKSAMVSSGNFTAHTVRLTSETEKFGKALETGKLKLGEYFGIITGRSEVARKKVQALAIEQVKLNNSIVTQDITKQGLYSVYTPTAIDKVAKATEIAAARQNIFNLAVREGSQQLVNFGKNTQWAGRQLTVGLSMPVLLFGSQAMKTFQEVNDQLVRLQKVYGTGLVQPTQKALAQIKGETIALAKELASTLGVAAKDTATMAADLAATGKTGIDLMNATREAMRLSKLGELETQAAMGATISLQNVYKLSTEELSGAVNFLNAVENQTSTSLQDLVDGIPRVGPIVQQLGGSFKDTALMMVAMKEAGVPAAQSANAIKSALASLINPTKKAREEFAAYNINLAGIAESTGGNPIKMIMALQQALKGLSSLNQAQLIETLFGKFQQARVQALIANLGAVNSQTKTAFDLASASAPALAAMAANEMKIATESTTGKFRRAVETLKADLIPVGEKIMEVATKILQFGSSIANFFNKLPGPIKSGLGILLTLGAIAGPVIMITGLFANLMGQVMKVGYSLLGVMNGTRKWKDLMTPAGIAAKAATDVFEVGLMANVAAVDTLNASITRLIVNIEGITTAMAMSTGSVQGAVASKLLLPGMPGFRKKMASGGIVPGNPSDGDVYPALLTGGETVIPVGPSKMYGGFINAMIDGKLPKYRKGKRRRGEIAIDSTGSNADSARDLGLPIDKPGSRFATGENAAYRGTFTQALPPAINSQLTGGSADPQEILDFADGLNLPEGATARGSRMHSGLYTFLQQQSTVSPEEQKQILDEAHKIYTDHLKKLAAEGKKVSDQELSRISSSSYDTAMEKLLKKDSTVKANYERETSAIGSASTPGGSYISKKTGKRETSGVSISRIKDPNSTMMDYRKIGERERLEFGDDAVQAHIVHPNLIKRVLRRKSSNVMVSGAEGVLTKKEIDELEGSGKAIGQAVDKGARSPAGLDEHSNSKKGKKAGKEYVGGVKDGIVESKASVVNVAEDVADSVHTGVDKGLNSPAGQSKLQSKFSKAFGPQSRLGAMMSNPMGRVGASMGLTMGMQMIAPMISSKLGDTAGGMMNSAMSGASMGMAFGPWGAAAGAAIGLVSSGIGKLIELEKLHKAQNDALWKPSADAAAFFGLTVADVTHTMTNFTNITSGALDSVNSLSTGLTYSNTQLDSFKKMLESLPANNELNLVIGSMKDAKTNEAAKALAQQFVQIQMAVNGMSQTQGNQLLQMMLTLSGKSATGANVGIKTQAEAIVNMLNAAKGNSERLSTLIGQITNVAANTTGWEAYKTIIDSIGKSAGSSSEMVAALIAYLKSVGDMGGAALTENLSRAGYTLTEIENLKKIWRAGIKASTDKLVPGSKLIDQYAKQATAILDNAKATKTGTDAVTGLTAAEKANVDALKEKKKILDAELKSLKDKLKAEQDLQSFNTTTTDIKNQILLAQASGDNLKAQLLQQQLIAKGQEYTAQNIINDKQGQSDLLGEKIANAMAKGNETLGTKLGDNSTATENNTDAIVAATPEGAATKAPKSLTSPNAYGSMGGGDGVSSAEVNKYITQRNKENPKLNLPAYGGDKWEEVIGKGKPGAGKTGLTGDAIRYMVEHGNDGKGYEKGDQFAYNGLTYNVTTGASSGFAGKAEVLPDSTGPNPSKAQQYNWAYPYKIEKSDFQSWMNAYNKEHSLKQGDPGYVYLDKLIKNGKWNTKWEGEAIASILTKAGIEQGQYLSFNGTRYKVDMLTTAGRGGAKIISHGKYVPPVKKADGGHISGPGSGTSDSIPALLSNGEYVIKADSVNKYGKGMFDSLNAGHYAEGGEVSKNGWLQKWARGLTGMPAAEMFGTAALLRKIAGLGQKGDNLAASMVPLNFMGMGGGRSLFLGMPRGIKALEEARKAEQVMKNIHAAIQKSAYKNLPVTQLGEQLESTVGKSFPVSGIGGLYKGANGTQEFVKPVTDALSGLSEIRSNQIARDVQGLNTPIQELIKIIDPSDPKGKRTLLALRSAFNPEFANPTGKFTKDQYIRQLVASLLRGDKDLQKANLSGNNLVDAGTSGVFNLASGIRELSKSMPSMKEQAAINLLGVKGGAKRFFAESTASIAKSMTPAEYNDAIVTEIQRQIPLLEKTIASFKLTDPDEIEAYANMLNRLKAGAGVDWSSFQSMAASVVPVPPKTPTAAALAKKAEELALKKRQSGHAVGFSDITFKDRIGGYSSGGMVPFPKYSLPSFDIGTPYVPSDMIAQIHKGEAIIPANQNNGTMGETNITIYAQNASAIEVAREVENILNRKAGMSGKTTLVGVNR